MLARGLVSEGHYCSDKERGHYPMGKSCMRWFTRECYLGAGVKAQGEPHQEAGVIELTFPGSSQFAWFQGIFSGEVLWNVSQHSSPGEGEGRSFNLFLVSHWLEAAPLFQIGHAWRPGGFPWATREAVSGRPGLEGPCQAAHVWSWPDSSWDWLPSQWQECEVSLRGFEAENKRWRIKGTMERFETKEPPSQICVLNV